MSNAAVTTPAARLAAVQRDGSVKPLSLAEAVEQLFALVGDANALNAVLDAAEQEAAKAAERLRLRSVGGAYVPAEEKADAAVPAVAEPKARCQGMRLDGKRCRYTAGLTDGVCGKHARFAVKPAFPSHPACEKPIDYAAEQPPQEADPAALPAPTQSPLPAPTNAEPPKPATRPRPQPKRPRVKGAAAPATAQPLALYVQSGRGSFKVATEAQVRAWLKARDEAASRAAA
jgi:hypothetical protein